MESLENEGDFNDVEMENFSLVDIDDKLQPNLGRDWTSEMERVLEKKSKIKEDHVDFVPGSPIERCLDRLPENSVITVLIIGRHGEGKSTLINVCCGKVVCQTSSGYKSETNISHGITISKGSKKIVLWDTEGHKEDPQMDILRAAHRAVMTLFEGYLDEEIPVYRTSWRIPVWLILTKISEEQMEEQLEQWEENLNRAQIYVDCIIPTAWYSEKKPPSTIYIKRLNDLLDKVVTYQISKQSPSLQINSDESKNYSNLALPSPNESTDSPKIIELNPLLPDKYDEERAASSSANLRRELIHTYFLRSLIPIGIALAGATAVGCSPVPFSDWFLLVPIQLSMMAGISYAYKLQVAKGSLLWLLGSTLTAIGGTLIGKFGLSLLKLVPGINIPVMAIDGVFSGFWTLAMGLAYSVTLRGLLLKEFDVSVINEDLVKMIAGEIQTRFRNNLGEGYSNLKKIFTEEVEGAEDPEITQSINKSLKDEENNLQKQRIRKQAEKIKSEEIVLKGMKNLCVSCRERQPEIQFKECQHKVVCKICWEDRFKKRSINFCPDCNKPIQ